MAIRGLRAQRILLGVALLGLLSCGKAKDIDKIGDAQFCLNNLSATPTSSEVNDCLSKVEGMSSAGAESIRCSGGFIREGFGSTDRFVKAFEAISSGTSASNMQVLMGLLSFTANSNIATDTTNAQNAFNSCLASGGKGSTILASFSYMTMSLMTYFTGKGVCSSAPVVNNGFKSYDLGACLTGCGQLANLATCAVPLVDATSTTDSAAVSAQNGVGSVIIAAYNTSCSGGTSANNQLCDLFKSAINSTTGGTSNPRGVAVKFFANLGLQ